MAKPLYVYVCPDCGEQIGQPDYTPEKGLEWGHYHDPPPDWPGGEDPWFDAEKIEAVPVQREQTFPASALDRAAKKGAARASAHWRAKLEQVEAERDKLRVAIESVLTVGLDPDVEWELRRALCSDPLEGTNQKESTHT